MTIKTATVRAFERRLNEGRSTWPQCLVDLGERALLSLKMIAGNSVATNEQIKQNCPATWASGLAMIEDFHAAHTEYERRAAPIGPRSLHGPAPCQEPATFPAVEL